MTRSSRHYLTVWCTLSCMVLLLWNRSPSMLENDGTMDGSSKFSKERPQAVALDSTLAADAVTLVPGELPGYTGWARLEHTLVGSFRIVGRDALSVVVGNEWNVTVECDHTECHGTAHFYARAYGPAVLAGKVHVVNNKTYSISFLPMDAGRYTVELVLISSGAPSWDEFPIVGEEPWYEGFLLPSFPLQLQVEPQNAVGVQQVREQQGPPCSLSHLLSNTTDSGYSMARWVVVDKVSHHGHVVSRNASRNVALETYRSNHQSLGIFMDYRYRRCTAPSFSQAAMRLIAETTKSANHPLHVIFVGDSVMRMQHGVFASTFPHLKATLISTSGGIVQMMQNVTTHMQSLSMHPSDNSPSRGKQERRFVLFNTGLHDINQLCSPSGIEGRSRYIAESDATLSCTAYYRRHLQQFASFVEDYPAELRVFQSTTAGWPRYGSYDIEWLKNETQSLTLTSNMVAKFNDIAYSVLEPKRESIQIMDAYWLTLARPDNRQVGLEKNLKKRLVHPGEEVLQTMVRNWILVLVEHLARMS